MCVNFILFKGKYKHLKPSFIAFERKYSYEIFSLGSTFFFIQIAAIIIYSTDNFIINYFLGSEEVTIYNVAFKYFMLATMGMTIILGPFWSAFTQAKAKNDMLWIRLSLINLLKVSCLASFTVIIMIFFANKVYFLWVGNTIQVPFTLTVFMGVNTIIQLFLQPVIMLINGIGKLKVQLVVGLTAATINIPLSILLAVHFDFGIAGVILATIMTRMLGLIVYPIQAYKILNGTAKNIWNA